MTNKKTCRKILVKIIKKRRSKILVKMTLKKKSVAKY